MTNARVSIKDIANVAGVSHPTVSRALNNSPRISASTRDRIRRLAEDMGYMPNAVAQSMQTRRTHIIGLVVTSISDPFLADVVNGAEEVARPAGLNIFLNSSHNDPEQELQVIETFHRQRVDGIVVASSRIGSNHVDRLKRVNVPAVLINNQAETESGWMHSITVDDQAGARLAVNHLLGLGHRRIGYIGVNNRPKSNTRRRRGYLEALAAAGVHPETEWIAHIELTIRQQDSDVQGGRQLAPRLIDAGATAIFCYNDMVAVGVLLACRERGLAVPRDLSVVGFDDIALARYVSPPLTSIFQPKRLMGRSAIRMLIDLLDNHPVENTVLRPLLVERESTAPPREA